MRAHLRERVSSPCGDDGEVEPAGHGRSDGPFGVVAKGGHRTPRSCESAASNVLDAPAHPVHHVVRALSLSRARALSLNIYEKHF